MPFVCHLYVFLCHLYVTRLWFYHEPMKEATVFHHSHTKRKVSFHVTMISSNYIQIMLKVFKLILKINVERKVCSHHTAYQPAITCSKLTIETLEQGVKYVQC